jgi:uncharacterized protein (DUF697 family)
MSLRPKSDIIIRNHVLMAAGGGLIPIPFVDIAAVTAVQLDMLQQLCNVYGLNFSRSSSRSLVTALTSSVLARLGASAIKIIPGVGSLLGGLSAALLSGAATYAVGEVFTNHFEAGGSIEDFDPMSYKDAYNKHFEEGKRKTRNWQEEEKDSQTIEEDESSKKEKLARLKELGELKENGVITKKEFDEMKKKILEEF